MTSIDFKPSQVVLAIPPLCGTMGKSEIEYAAALYICACRHFGDEWQPLPPEKIGEAINADLDAKKDPLHSLRDNPFFRPDLHAFVHSEFVNMEYEHGPIEFTEAGYEAIRKWVSRCTCGILPNGEVVRTIDCPVVHGDNRGTVSENESPAGQD